MQVNGKVIGAIGVSGESPREDEDVAKAGAAAKTYDYTPHAGGASFRSERRHCCVRSFS
jgi:hypothetical protein